VDFGWNREERYVHWQGKLSVNKGRIVSVTPCFRGAAFTSPQEGETEFKTHVNRILSVGEKETELDLYSSKNPNTTTAAMQAVILDLEMPKDGVLTADFNGKKFEHTLGELLEGSRSHFMIGWLSEAILFNRAMPESCFTTWKTKSLSATPIIIMYACASATDNGHGVLLYGLKEFDNHEKIRYRN